MFGAPPRNCLLSGTATTGPHPTWTYTAQSLALTGQCPGFVLPDSICW